MKTAPVLNSVIVVGFLCVLSHSADAATDLDLDGLTTGNHSFTADSQTFDRIQVVGHDSGGGATNNYFTLMEVGAAFEAIPEPSTMVLLGLGGMFALRRRKKTATNNS